MLLADAEEEVVYRLADGVVRHVDARDDLRDDVEPRVDRQLVKAIFDCRHDIAPVQVCHVLVGLFSLYSRSLFLV